MSEPKRWLEEDAPRDIELLVRAAQAEQPDEASLGRTLTALGIGLGVSSIALGAQAAGMTASAGGAGHVTVITGGLLAKWAALGATLGTLAAGAATIASDAPHAPEALPSSLREPQPPEPKPLLPLADGPKPTPVEQGSSASAAASRAAPVARAAPAIAPPSAESFDAETLAEEVRSMDSARATLAAGRAVETLLVLDEYERRFRERRFAPEALYLRMEAFVSLGQAAQARAAAERLLASHPQSPHGARARFILSKNP